MSHKPFRDCDSCERSVHWRNLRRCDRCEEPICIYCGNNRGESFDEPGDVYLCDVCLIIEEQKSDGCSSVSTESDHVSRTR